MNPQLPGIPVSPNLLRLMGKVGVLIFDIPAVDTGLEVGSILRAYP